MVQREEGQEGAAPHRQWPCVPSRPPEQEGPGTCVSLMGPGRSCRGAGRAQGAWNLLVWARAKRTPLVCGIFLSLALGARGHQGGRRNKKAHGCGCGRAGADSASMRGMRPPAEVS